jgi:hypothetical protein
MNIEFVKAEKDLQRAIIDEIEVLVDNKYKNASLATRQVFKDLMEDHKNKIHWTDGDIKYFLSAKGRFVSECITRLQPGENDTIPAVLASEKFRNIKKLIVCVYSSAITCADYGKILEQVSNTAGSVEILAGWICDEKTHQDSITIHLIALCTE